MSRRGIIALLVWAVVVIVPGKVYTNNIIKPSTYKGSEITFTAEKGYYIDLETTVPVRINVASPEYFHFVQANTDIYGIPETPPLNYSGTKYFFLDAQLGKGRLEVVEVEGSSISIKLVGEESFSIVYSPTTETVNDAIVDGTFFAFLLLVAGLLIWEVGLMPISEIAFEVLSNRGTTNCVSIL